MRFPGSTSLYQVTFSLFMLFPAFAACQQDGQVTSHDIPGTASGLKEFESDSALKELYYFSFNLGIYNMRSSKHTQALFDAALYPPWKLWFINFYGGLFVSTNTCSMIYAGITIPISFLDRCVFRISLAPGIFVARDNEADLKFPLEFRTSIRLAVQLNKKSRLGLEFSHVSNAGLGLTNPGTETLVVSFEMPFD